MVYVILLTDYQGNDGPDNYSVTYEGSQEDCEAQQDHDGRTYPKAKADYAYREVEAKSLQQGTRTDNGVIAELTALADGIVASVKLKKPRRKKRTSPARRIKPQSEPGA